MTKQALPIHDNNPKGNHLDAVDLLTRQHRTLEATMKALKASTDDAERAALLARAGDDLTVHLASEEEIFYPAVRERSTEDILLESLEEHLSLKRLLADLIALPLSAPTFDAKFQVLKEQAYHFARTGKKVRARLEDVTDLVHQRVGEMDALYEVVAGEVEEAAIDVASTVRTLRGNPVIRVARRFLGVGARR